MYGKPGLALLKRFDDSDFESQDADVWGGPRG